MSGIIVNKTGSFNSQVCFSCFHLDNRLRLLADLWEMAMAGHGRRPSNRFLLPLHITGSHLMTIMSS